MGWITKPTALDTEGELSDYTHITSFYDQMSDGEHDISVSGIECQEIVANQLTTTALRFHFMPITLTNGGSLHELYVNTTMENNGYYARNYPGAFIIVHSKHNTFPPQMVQSMQYNIKYWKWILISNEGTQWTYDV